MNRRDIMIKKAILLTSLISLTACVTTVPVKIAPYDLPVNASKSQLYNLAVDCTLEHISAPTGSGQFFDYQDKESGKLSVAFRSSYILGFSAIPLKSTMSFKIKDGNVNIRFSPLMQYMDSVGWTNVFQESDGTTSDAEVEIVKVTEAISDCIKNSL